MEPKTTPELNAEIVNILRIEDEDDCSLDARRYAAARIEELEAEVERLKEGIKDALVVLENNLNLPHAPHAICYTSLLKLLTPTVEEEKED